MNTSEHHRKLGNDFFAKQLYPEAIREYSTAIIKNPNIPVYYTNRALCFLKQQKDYERVIIDCERAIELDTKSVKGHYLTGQALLEVHRYNEATGHLRKAMEMGLEQKVPYVDEISTAFRKAKKATWEAADARRRLEESDLCRYLTSLVERDRQRQLDQLQTLHHSNNTNSGSSDSLESERENMILLHNERLSQIAALFEAANDSGKLRTVPDWMIGKINFEVMSSPVITPSGITYDKAEIVTTLQKLGPVDPLSRQPCRESDLVPNLALKEAIDEFLNKNGWAADF
ncbi:hypothetical protein SeLEV6574_g04148 [Synchytrium endobioticum]|nr:hypothetical protein SeLEV6574_g04148 [Synchytrium endobioticum]